MKKQNIPYSHFNNYVLRTPLLSLNFFYNLMKKEKISDAEFKCIWKKSIIQEAVFLASPTLYFEMEKWNKGEKTDKKEVTKLKNSFLKYLTRMSSRCTPFGLFAGCKTGHFKKETKIELSQEHNYRATRLDMNYLVALSQDLSKKSAIKTQLKFYPNTSIYVIGSQLRYIEYSYINSKRQHQITAVENNEYLEVILERALSGANMKTLANTITDEDITLEEAQDFIDELIENQLLISELEPSVTGNDFFNQIIKTLQKLQHTEPILEVLQKVKISLQEIDKNFENNIGRYLEISNDLKKLDTKFELKYLFQTDMKLNTSENTIDESLIDSVKKGLHILNLFTTKISETHQSQFINAFQERYQEREMSLSKVLDLDVGIGYKQNAGSSDSNPLIDDIAFPSVQTQQEATQKINWSSKESMLYKKIIQTLIEKNNVLTLTEADFSNQEPNWDDLPDTMSSMVKLVKIDGKDYIMMNSAGGSSAANLLGRFSANDNELAEYVNEITTIEQQANSTKIIAEIVHLPESRVGNILYRPHIRDYEIPYLAQSTLPHEQQIDIADIKISIKNKRVILRSESKNKEIIPRLTTAHNYQAKALPIYHFLCDLQHQNTRMGISFNWGPLENEFDFLPRVIYKNIILSSAQWVIKKDTIKHLQKNKNNDEVLKNEVLKWKNKNNLPKHVIIEEGDNTMLIDLENISSVQMFLSVVKKYGQFKLKEFLFNAKEELVTSKKKSYTNQFIFSFYNHHNLRSQQKN